MRSVSGLVLALLGATGGAVADDTARPVDVHFTAPATAPDGSTVKAAPKARPSEAARKAKELEQAYAAPPKTLADSAREMAKGAGTFGGGLLRAVEHADQAHLVVEVTGRRSWASKSWLDSDDQFGFLLRLSAGSKLAEGRLHGAAARWPEDKELDIVVVNELHGYSDDEPYWLLQVQGGGSFGSLANRTDGILADFVRMNGGLFAGK